MRGIVVYKVRRLGILLRERLKRLGDFDRPRRIAPARRQRRDQQRARRAARRRAPNPARAAHVPNASHARRTPHAGEIRGLSARAFAVRRSRPRFVKPRLIARRTRALPPHSVNRAAPMGGGFSPRPALRRPSGAAPLVRAASGSPPCNRIAAVSPPQPHGAPDHKKRAPRRPKQPAEQQRAFLVDHARRAQRQRQPQPENDAQRRARQSPRDPRAASPRAPLPPERERHAPGAQIKRRERRGVLRSHAMFPRQQPQHRQPERRGQPQQPRRAQQSFHHPHSAVLPIFRPSPRSPRPRSIIRRDRRRP